MTQNLITPPPSKYSYKIAKVDTDAITIYKDNGEVFGEEECFKLLEDLNSWLPKKITLEYDGLYKAPEESQFKNGLVVVKSKNYILIDKNKMKLKGSSLTDQKKEKALLEMIKDIGHSILNGINYEELSDIYHKYCLEAINVQDIKRWCVKKTITKAVVDCANNPDARTNEKKVWDAVKHLSPQEGDKVLMYDSIDGEIQAVAKGEPQFYKDGRPKMVPNTILKLHTDFKKDTIDEKLLKRVYDTLKIFSTLLDMDKFVDYSKPKNRKLLDEFFE